ncbi:MAG: hypothetical protein Tsb008_17880 [Rhodothalassiaceae bacterium]
MALILLLALIALPLIEVAVFIAVGTRIGVAPVLILTIATAVLGLAIARAEGIETLARAREALHAGRPPVIEMVEGALLALAGLLLLVPGFLSDTAGALLLIAPLRRLFAARIARAGGADEKADVFIEGSYRVLDPEAERLPGWPDRDPPP